MDLIRFRHMRPVAVNKAHKSIQDIQFRYLNRAIW